MTMILLSIKVLKINISENLVWRVPYRKCYMLLKDSAKENLKSPSGYVHKGVGEAEMQIQIRQKTLNLLPVMYTKEWEKLKCRYK
jgi:hypothetical protein